ncbi:MAG: DUF4339 domain-containing protein [Pirellulaceae bacterium]|nr:DUF4339 domain-containing protein [Pirellulaceae bacterium]
MNPVDWYYARDNQQQGPVSSAELKQLAAGGGLRPDDLVWREGMTEWAAARNVRGLFEAAPAPAAARPAEASPAPVAPAAGTGRPTPREHPLDALVEWSRIRFSAGLVDSVARLFRACGSYGLLAAVLLCLIFAVLRAVEAEPAASLLTGAIMLLALLVLQYAAVKSCDSLDRLNLSTTGRLPSTVFPFSLSMVSKMLGAVLLLASIITAVKTSAYTFLIPLGIAEFLVFAYISLAALHPEKLNFLIGGEVDPGEEGLQTATFVFKAIVRAAPVMFGAGVLYGAILMGYACHLIILDNENILLAESTAVIARSTLILSALIPPAAYLAFLLYYLLHDFCRAILSIPSKLESRAAGEENGSDAKELHR